MSKKKKDLKGEAKRTYLVIYQDQPDFLPVVERMTKEEMEEKVISTHNEVDVMIVDGILIKNFDETYDSMRLK